MKSPFPGMDPYLERHWQDIHARMILYACDQLEDQLPDNLIARVEERLVLETEDEETRSIYPDVKILHDPLRGGSALPISNGGTAVMEPIVIRYRSEPATVTCINILDPTNYFRLVTVIEILSLANRMPGEGQRQYRKKQSELAGTKVSLVEIDLLRRGERVFSLPAAKIPVRRRAAYQACVRKGWDLENHLIYPLSLRKPLPAIHIPLRQQDDEIRLDLQALIELAYRKGRYHLTIDYGETPEPPLTGADAKWANGLLRKFSHRS